MNKNYRMSRMNFELFYDFFLYYEVLDNDYVFVLFLVFLFRELKYVNIVTFYDIIYIDKFFILVFEYLLILCYLWIEKKI